MVITSKGQVTIPRHIRERHGLTPGTTVEFSGEGGSIVFCPVKPGNRARVDAWLKCAIGAARGKFTTAQIMRLTRR